MSDVGISASVPLLVVDAQVGFVNRHSERALPVIRRLIDVWGASGRPVFLSRFVNEPRSQWETLIGWTRLREDQEIALHPSIERGIAPEMTVFDKTSYSSLTGPVSEYLGRTEADTVVICGIATDGCVLKTAVDIFDYSQRPVRPVVVVDGCASHAGEEIHDMGLLLTGRFIGRSQLVSSCELLAPHLKATEHGA